MPKPQTNTAAQEPTLGPVLDAVHALERRHDEEDAAKVANDGMSRSWAAVTAPLSETFTRLKDDATGLAARTGELGRRGLSGARDKARRHPLATLGAGIGAGLGLGLIAAMFARRRRPD